MCVRVSQVSSRARDARAHGRKFLSGCNRVAPVTASLSSGAGACTHVPQAPFPAQEVCAGNRKSSSVRLSGAQRTRPRIAVAGSDGRSAESRVGWGSQ